MAVLVGRGILRVTGRQGGNRLSRSDGRERDCLLTASTALLHSRRSPPNPANVRLMINRAVAAASKKTPRRTAWGWARSDLEQSCGPDLAMWILTQNLRGIEAVQWLSPGAARDGHRRIVGVDNVEGTAARPAAAVLWINAHRRVLRENTREKRVDTVVTRTRCASAPAQHRAGPPA